MNITNIVKIIKNYVLHILLFILIVLTAVSIRLINKDIHAIKEIKRDKIKLEAKIELHNKKGDVLKQKDTINKSDLLMFQSEGIDLKKELHDFENNKEEEIKDLYMHEMKYWAYLIALLVSLFVFIGIKWNFHEYVTKRLASLFDENKDDFEKLIRDKSWEFSLIKKARIMVADVNPDNKNPYLKKVLKWFGEEGNGNSKSLIELPNINFNDDKEIDKLLKEIKEKYIADRFNILLIDNSGDTTWNLKDDNNKKTANYIAVNLPEEIFLVYYGPEDNGRFPSDFTKYLKEIKQSQKNGKNLLTEDEIKELNQKITNRVSFANAPSKLYVSLVETLKYMDILNDDINA